MLSPATLVSAADNPEPVLGPELTLVCEAVRWPIAAMNDTMATFVFGGIFGFND
jgi:hypothetical protein